MPRFKILSSLFAGLLITLVSAEGTVCAPGYFITDSGACRKCTKGTFQPKADQYGCKPCPDNMVSMEEGSTECVSCRENEEPSSFNNKCVCIPGAIFQRGRSCTLCEPGTKYNGSRPGRGSCQTCDNGYYQPDAGQTTCLRCPPGSSSPYGATKCFVCPDDEIFLNDEACGTCPAGQTKTSYGNYCEDCHTRTVKADKGIHPCEFCPVGEEPNADKTACMPMTCPSGQTLLKKGKKMRCGMCRPGQYYDEYSMTCEKCSANSFMPYANIDGDCYDCAENEYALMRGATECIKCPQGQRLLESGECGTCPAGYEYNRYDNSCTPCRINTYSKANMDYCMDCPTRLYSLPKATTCFSCPRGQALIEASRECGTCPAGRNYDKYDGKCDKCYDGSFKSRRGIEDSCEICPSGTRSNERRTTCLPEKAS